MRKRHIDKINILSWFFAHQENNAWLKDEIIEDIVTH